MIPGEPAGPRPLRRTQEAANSSSAALPLLLAMETLSGRPDMPTWMLSLTVPLTPSAFSELG